MKKLILFAAAVAAIASCAKVETVSTTGPKLISFKSIDAPMTKVDGDLSQNVSLGVNARWNPGKGSPTEYFKNAEFAYESLANSWVGKQYWPKTGNLDFLVYAPYKAEGVTFTYNTIDNATEATIEYTVDNADVDLLYGKLWYDAKSTDTSSGNIPVVLKHAKAQIIVNVKCNDATINDLYQINSVSFTNLTTSGTAKVTYDLVDTKAGTLEFSNPGSAAAVTVDGLTTSVINSDTPVFTKYIYPTGNQDKLTIIYSVKTGENHYVKAEPVEYDLTKSGTTTIAWKEATRYIFNITFTADEIKFTPTVETWGKGTGLDETI